MTTENAPVTPHAFQLVPENKAGSAYIFCPNCGATRWLRAAGEPVNEPCRPASPATGEGLDVERLRAAIYAVSVRHDWEHTTDREDRTEEIAAEYAALAERLVQK